MNAARIAGVLLVFFLAAPAQAADADSRETKALHALFDRNWQDLARRFPEGSTYRGDLRYNDKLADESAAGVERLIDEWIAGELAAK